MASYSLLNLTTQVRAIGRAAVFYSTSPFAGTGTSLALIHLGDTEGEINIEANEEFSKLTLPELTGPAPHTVYYAGEAPIITIPIYAADPALRAILSPTGSKNAGYERRRAVTPRSLVLFPEELFIESDAQVAVAYTQAGGWTVGGNAATAAQLALLDLSIWFWRGFFHRALPIYKHEDGGKVVQEVEFEPMHASVLQDGHHLYTVGRPEQASPAIQIEVP